MWEPGGCIVRRLKVKLLDHVPAGRSWHRQMLRLSSSDPRKVVGSETHTNAAIGLVQYGKCVNNVSGVNALSRPRPKKRSRCKRHEQLVADTRLRRSHVTWMHISRAHATRTRISACIRIYFHAPVSMRERYRSQQCVLFQIKIHENKTFWR